MEAPTPRSGAGGEGAACADVFAADEAKREHESLKAKVAALKQVAGGASESGAPRERSRSPRQSQDLLASSGA